MSFFGGVSGHFKVYVGELVLEFSYLPAALF